MTWQAPVRGTLVPDGRIFGQITQEAPKNYLWPEKIGGRKMEEFGKK
jgi:hypothetical protein